MINESLTLVGKAMFVGVAMGLSVAIVLTVVLLLLIPHRIRSTEKSIAFEDPAMKELMRWEYLSKFIESIESVKEGSWYRVVVVVKKTPSGLYVGNYESTKLFEPTT